MECPACPHPGKNMPEDWQDKYESKPYVFDRDLLSSTKLFIRHLHAQYIAVDANFRLKQKERGFSNSGTLGPGWGYFVDPISFARELQRFSSTPQVAEVRFPDPPTHVY
jgi:hypothetical protein